MTAASRRIVFATFGSLGDLHPYLALARELKARGHRPLVATHPGYRPRVEADGVDFHPVRPDMSVFGDETVLMKKVMSAQGGPEFIIRRVIMPHLRESAADLAEALVGADFLLSHTLTFAGPLLAEQRGLPWASTVLAPTGFFSNLDPPVLAPMPALTRLRALGPGFYAGFMKQLKKMSFGWTEPVRALRREMGLPPTDKDPLFEGQFSPLGTLALYSGVMGDPQADWPPHSHLTGFPFYDPAEGEPPVPELAAFLAAGDPPLVFTLGSSAVLDAGDFFTQSARAAQRLGRRAVLLIGRDPRNRPVEPLPPGILALEYAPHGPLFRRAAAVVHQGGIGTTAQALRAGVPMLFLPYGFDQPDNAARVERLGIARTISRGRYRAERVARELGALLSDATVLQRAEAIGRRVDAEEGVATACDLIEGWLV